MPCAAGKCSTRYSCPTIPRNQKTSSATAMCWISSNFTRRSPSSYPTPPRKRANHHPFTGASSPPAHFLPQVREALILAKEQGLTIPVVYNSSGYEKAEMLRYLEGLVDIYLPDLKYLEADLAGKYSHAKDYPEVAMKALEEMVRQVGMPEFDERGMMKKGVIVRHLLLPGCLADGKRVVKYLHETYENRIYMSLMSQYTPLESLDAVKYPELNRKVPEYAYEKLVDYAISLGTMQAFIQEGDTAKESFIPPFTLEGV